MKFVAGSCVLLLLGWQVPVTEAAAPIVYADDSITVHAAVAEAGTEAIHLGDALTLIVEAVFDPDEVQVERLDEEWFRRTFSVAGALALYGSGNPVTASEGGNRIRLTMQWQFQVVGCPHEAGHCPGLKYYELPLASVAYRLASATEPGAGNRSARFRPWPGSLTVLPSIRFETDGHTAIGTAIAGGAWPEPKRADHPHTASAALLLLGGVLLGSGLIAGRRRRPMPRASQLHRNSRWERAAMQLEDDTLDDEAWSDLLRRCLTWYCLDELGRNPFEWLRADPGRAPDALTVECRELFYDVLAEPRIDAARRSTFRARFTRATARRIDLQ